jgi:seryl-tRNA synthetase
MTSRKRIEDKILKKEQEIQELEMKIREAKAYVQALHDIAKMLPKEQGEAVEDEESETSIREGSYVDDARKAISEAGKPLHVVDILKSTGKEDNRKNRIGMSGSLAAYVRRGEIFTRPRPNTFGLISMGSALGTHKSVPPDDFGIGDDDSSPE